jgi:N-acetyl-anhydromuramyl-L-alanine amidase AmpD
LLLAGSCRHVGNEDARWLSSKNHDARRAVVVVVHATEQDSVEASLATLRGANASGPVSAHYLIGRDGSLYQLVDERRRAWHAGGGRWGTITDLNSASIGIELDNDGTAPFPAVQVARLVALLDDVCARNHIPRRQVIGHADLAPWRKRDPGPRFPWKALAEAGFGAWPRPDAGTPPDRFDGWVALELVGYPMREPMAALRAFRMHFRGLDDAVTPMGDADRQILYGLVGEAWQREPVAPVASEAAATPVAPSPL